MCCDNPRCNICFTGNLLPHRLGVAEGARQHRGADRGDGLGTGLGRLLEVRHKVRVAGEEVGRGGKRAEGEGVHGHDEVRRRGPDRLARVASLIDGGAAEHWGCKLVRGGVRIDGKAAAVAGAAAVRVNDGEAMAGVHWRKEGTEASMSGAPLETLEPDP